MLCVYVCVCGRKERAGAIMGMVATLGVLGPWGFGGVVVISEPSQVGYKEGVSACRSSPPLIGGLAITD